MSINDNALRLIKEYGVALTLARKSPGTVDPVTGLLSASTTQNYPVRGVPRSGEKTLLGMDKVYMLSATVAPLIGDTMIDADGTFAIRKVETMSFKGSVIYYLVGLAK